MVELSVAHHWDDHFMASVQSLKIVGNSRNQHRIHKIVAGKRKVYAQFWPELGPVKIPSHFFGTKSILQRLYVRVYGRLATLVCNNWHSGDWHIFSYFRINCILMGFWVVRGSGLSLDTTIEWVQVVMLWHVLHFTELFAINPGILKHTHVSSTYTAKQF